MRVRAAAAEGQATEACLRTIAAAAGISRSRVTLIRGASARQKLVDIDAPAAALKACWPNLRMVGD